MKRLVHLMSLCYSQYFCYRTNMRMISGFTLCDPVFVRRRNLSILDRSDTSILYFLNTPGRLRGANHVNRYVIVISELSLNLFVTD